MGNEGSRVLDRVTNIPGPVTYFSITLKVFFQTFIFQEFTILQEIKDHFY